MHSTTTLIRISCLLLLLGLVQGDSSCPRLKPADGLEIGQILGTWYAVRGIEHSSQANSTSAKQTKVCPVMKIITKSENIIEFQWNSKDKPQKKIELLVNKNNPGYLEYKNKKGTSKGSLRSLQISINGGMRNMIGVTMCKSGGKYASVILNREASFVEDGVTQLTNILASQGLSVTNIYDRCVKN